MFRVLALLCLVAPAAFAASVDSTSAPKYYLLHKELLEDGQENITYWEAPSRLADALDRGYVQLDMPSFIPETFRDVATLWRPSGGASYCPLYNKEGYVLGNILAFDRSIMTNELSDFANTGYYEWTVEVEGKKITYWATAMFFVCDPNAVTEWDSSKIVQSDKMCTLAANGELNEVYTAMSKNTGHSKQKCMDTRGVHYFPTMTTESKCDNSLAKPFCYAGEDGEFWGMGFMAFCNREYQKNKFYFSVKWDQTDVPKALVTYPQCLMDYAISPSIVGYAVFIHKPQDFVCSS